MMDATLTSADIEAVQNIIVGQLTGLSEDRQGAKSREIAGRLGTDEKILLEVLRGKRPPSAALAERLQVAAIFGELPRDEPADDAPSGPAGGFLDKALDLVARGYHIFPVRAGTKDQPHIKKFPERATRDPEQIKAWGARWPTANIGISTSRFGDDGALLVIDADNKSGKDGDGELAKLMEAGRELSPTYTQATPTGGHHYVFRCPAAVKQGANVLAPGVDIRSKGGYIVAAGSVTEKGVYVGDDRPVAPAPQWLIDRCGRAPERAEKTVEPVPGIDPERAAERAKRYLLEEAPLATEGAGGDSTTYTVACRVKDFGVDEPHCLQLMVEHWNGRCSPPWPLDELEKKVANAFSYGAERPGSAAPESQFEPVNDVGATAAIEAPNVRAKESSDLKASRPKLTLTRLQDIRPAAKKVWLIGDVLGQEEMSVVYGAPGEGKTFLATHLATCISTGSPFYGRPVLQGGVVIVAGEGEAALFRRLLAIRKHCGLNADEPLGVITSDLGMNLYRSESDAPEIISRVREFERETGAKVRLIIIDTLASVTSGADENSAKDMTALHEKCHIIRKQTKANVLLVHHTGKNEANGPRGHSSLEGRVDTMLYVSKPNVKIQKQRDGETGETFTFDLEPVTIECLDGSLDTVPVFKEVAAADARLALHIEGRTKDAYEALQQALDSDGEPAPEGVGWGAPKGARIVSAKRWQAAFYEKMADSTPEVKRRTFSRAVEQLVKSRLVRTSDEKQLDRRFAWIVRPPASQEFEAPSGAQLF
ncbi:AAA family ATPase [Rhodospirillaceae bacterium SYSU D60014]|uniref:AAA family ATPase n=1 Tax=Virgifigura deserti TaxID=2268457 RepID=UPI000E66C6BE